MLHALSFVPFTFAWPTCCDTTEAIHDRPRGELMNIVTKSGATPGRTRTRIKYDAKEQVSWRRKTAVLPTSSALFVRLNRMSPGFSRR
jgi:hypothetical protein